MLQKEIDYKGFTTNACYKITGQNIIEGEIIDGVKTYNVFLTITSYTNITKKYPIEGVNEYLTGLYEGDLNLTNYYNILKTLDNYSNSTDV